MAASFVKQNSWILGVSAFIFIHQTLVCVNVNMTADDVFNITHQTCNQSVAVDLDISTNYSIDISGCGLHSYTYIHQFCGQIGTTVINVSRNNIHNIDGLLCNWPSIQLIDFSYNEIAALKKNSFAGGKMVLQLYLAENDIDQIDTEAFNDLSNLKLLDLAGNNLKGINRNFFNGVINLVSLNLSRNNIRFITAETFSILRSLMSLDLSYNRIFELNSLAFEGLSELDVLLLQGNILKRYTLDFLGVFKHITLVNLSRNEFSHFRRNTFCRYNVSKLVIARCPHLAAISSFAFEDSSFLKEIDLSENDNLYYIQERSFVNLDNLHLVNLSCSSKLHFVPSVPNEALVDISDMGLFCDCYENLSHHKSGNTTVTYGTYCDVANETTRALTSKTTNECGPFIVSNIQQQYSLYIGESVNIDCLAVGHPWPYVRWERYRWNGSDVLYDLMSWNVTSFNLKANFLSDNGKYRCVASNIKLKEVFITFEVSLQLIDIGVKILSCGFNYIDIAWNRTHDVARHVILYRAYEKTTSYHVQEINEYWKLFRINGLHPITAYEICIASKSDETDRNCVRTKTIREQTQTMGIHKDSGVITVLCISGFIFGVFVLATLYRCMHKLRVIAKQHVFIVSSESREYFGDVTEATFTYENQHSDFVLEGEDKTEL